jgi:hypothetical protein
MDDPTLLSWIEKGQNIAALLVAIGVAAEFALGFMAGPARHRTEQAKDAEIVRLTDKAGSAYEHASEVEQENIKLRIALDKLKRSSGPRYLSREEQDQLVDILPQKAFRIVQIMSAPGNGEADRFGDDFETVFKRLHWGHPPTRWSPSNPTEGMDPRTGKQIIFAPSGITIRVVDPSNPPPAAMSLKSALEKLDFPLSSTIDKAKQYSGGSIAPSEYLEFVIGDNPQNTR